MLTAMLCTPTVVSPNVAASEGILTKGPGGTSADQLAQGITSTQSEPIQAASSEENFKLSDDDDEVGDLSGGEREHEEDFGIDGVSIQAPGSKRKAEKVQQQLIQGTAKLVSTGKSRVNKSVASNEESNGSDYDFPTSGADESDESNEPAPPDPEWQALIAARAARPRTRPPAAPTTKALKNDMHTVEREGPSTADAAKSVKYSHSAVTPVGANEKPPPSTGRYIVNQPTAAQKKPVQYGTAEQRARASKVLVFDSNALSWICSHSYDLGTIINRQKAETRPHIDAYWPEGAKTTAQMLARRKEQKKPIELSSDSSDNDSGIEVLSKAQGKLRVLPKKSKPVTMPTLKDRDGSDKDGGRGDESSGVDDSIDPDLKPKTEPIQGEKRWPPETHLTYTQEGKVVGINAQRSGKIKSLLSDAIARALPRALVRVNAYPTPVQRPAMFLDILVDTSVRLGLNEITLRLVDDTAYAQDMMKIPIKRMCTVRGPMFDACRDVAWEGYGLKALEHDPVELQKAVTVLLTDNQFICPGKLVNGRYTDFKPDLPFCAEPIIKIAHCLFLGPNAWTTLEDAFFTSTITEGIASTQPEIPQVMAAFIATLAGAAIREGLDGVREPIKKGEGFNSLKQEKHYQVHLDTLKTLSPIGSHKILGYIYKTAKAYQGVVTAQRNAATTFVNPSTAGMSIEL
ncbi:hypothetical protein EVJ58_g10164 [Rhodofomes roseus]|uniref:DUF6532 domain-containing protein n=1 Tax=Rhodofomes roseus TaxID=34475 RepID=A0A4Y9XPY6_9APHY|nr:hypothetical protein EVJ58_g10164 [Rhodofomes roseus]